MSNYLTVDSKDIERAERMLEHLKGQAPKVLSNALNRSLENARSNAVNGARENYNVRAKDVRSTIKLQRAKPSRLMGAVWSTGKVLPLTAFKVNPGTVNGRRRTPIRVGVRKGSVETLERAFIARSGNFNGVYARKGKSRLPIQQLYGPAVPQMLSNESVVKLITDEARATFAQRVDHEIDRVLQKEARG